MSRIIAGIDPGVKTGVALWDTMERKFISINTWNIHQAINKMHWLRQKDSLREIRFEDARLRKWFPEVKNSPEAIKKLQGAGSVKRDCSIWQEFCEYHGIPFQAIAPARGQTKWTAEYFKRLTGWQGRTSQHARDAAALVFGV